LGRAKGHAAVVAEVIVKACPGGSTAVGAQDKGAERLRTGVREYLTNALTGDAALSAGKIPIIGVVVDREWNGKSVRCGVSGLVLLDRVNFDKASDRRKLEVCASLLVWDAADDGLLGRDMGEEVTGNVSSASESAQVSAAGVGKVYNKEVKSGWRVDLVRGQIGGIPGAARVPPI